MAKELQRKTYTVQQILDYMECPLCYDLKYNKGIPPSSDFLAHHKNIAYQEAVLETIRFYYFEHQAGSPPALKTLYDKFYNFWADKTNEPKRIEILGQNTSQQTVKQKQESSKYIKMGYETLKKFYGQNSQIKQAVLAVHHPYTIEMNELVVEGTFDLVREIETLHKRSKKPMREIQLVNFQLTTRKPDLKMLENDLQLSAMLFGFTQTFGVAPDKFLLQYLNREEEVMVYKEEQHFKRMLVMFEAFNQSVETITPYPRPGAHIYGSPYKELCDNYIY